MRYFVVFPRPIEKEGEDHIDFLTCEFKYSHRECSDAFESIETFANTRCPCSFEKQTEDVIDVEVEMKKWIEEFESQSNREILVQTI